MMLLLLQASIAKRVLSGFSQDELVKGQQGFIAVSQPGKLGL